jgi:hypothetical protein
MRDADLERRIADAADAYQRAADAKDAASKALADLMREAHSKGEQQSAVLRAAKHVWSREYQRIVLGLTKRKAGDGETSRSVAE